MNISTFAPTAIIFAEFSNGGFKSHLSLIQRGHLSHSSLGRMAFLGPVFQPSHSAPALKPKLTIHPLLPQSSSPSTFPLFPHLPPELRLRIWRFCLPGPRHIRINSKCNCSRPSSYPTQTFTAIHPTLLSVNGESRTEALRHYTIICSLDDRSSLAFNHLRDVYLPSAHECSDLAPAAFTNLSGSFNIPPYVLKSDTQVKYLAIYESTLQYQRNTAAWVELDELIIVVAPKRNLVWPHSVFRERERVLGKGGVLGQEEGWGDAIVLNGLMREFEGLRKGEKGVHGEDRIPVVRIVQPRVMDSKPDPFCVKVTPLSLWK
ncbi:hypothetical protein BKA65DRAFT_65835 [Rhexocercosporidium sp. MPI-PUGE-AT-0058]|nr:hypothetical protein BKA65DRAFT_65835 [Rhexocercosporidium sp. MPI-PUGE-AT-0058]